MRLKIHRDKLKHLSARADMSGEGSTAVLVCRKSDRSDRTTTIADGVT